MLAPNKRQDPHMQNKISQSRKSRLQTKQWWVINLSTYTYKYNLETENCAILNEYQNKKENMNNFVKNAAGYKMMKLITKNVILNMCHIMCNYVSTSHILL